MRYINKKTKKKYIITAVILAAVIIIVSAIVVFSYSYITHFRLPDGARILTGNQNGEVILYDNNGQVIDQVKLQSKNTDGDKGSTDFISDGQGAQKYFLYEFEKDSGYAFDNEHSILYRILVEDDKLAFKSIYNFDSLQISTFKIGFNNFYFVTADMSAIYCYDGSDFIEIYSNSYVESTCLDQENEIFYFATNDTFFKYDKGELSSVYLGDRTLDILVSKGHVYIANEFGSNNQKAVVHVFTKNLESKGWAEIAYAGNIRLLASENGGVYVSQTLQDEESRLIKINKDLSTTEVGEFKEPFERFGFSQYGIYAVLKEKLYPIDKDKIKEPLEVGTDYVIVY